MFRKLASLFLIFCGQALAQGVIYPAQQGLDCSGKTDNSPVWNKLLASTGDDTTFVLPIGCIDQHASTVAVSSRSNFSLVSVDRVQNGGGNNRPIELWTGSVGGMWDFQANQAPTIEGFLFTNASASHLDYFLRFDGNPSARIGTEALVRYNTFTNTRNDPNFSAITINVISQQNHEKNVITDNDFFCSQSSAFRESDSTQITSGSTSITCGLGNCTYLSDAKVGDRVRISYATGILDTSIASIVDDNHLTVTTGSTSTQSNARLHFRQAYGNGITIGSVNSKHNTLDRNSFTQCARGLNVINGSFSAEHLSGYADDVLAYIGNVAEPSELAYLEDEIALREVYVENIDAPLVIRYARNSIYNAESDGFFYFNKSARVTITASSLQSTPIKNSVLIRASNPYTVVLLSIGNLWAPGAVD